MAPILLALVIAFAATRVKRNSPGRELIPAMLALTLVYYYFAASAGLTFWTGSRVLYPVEGVGLMILALLVAVLFKAFPKKSAGEGSLPH